MSSAHEVEQQVGDREEVHWLYCMVFEFTEEGTTDRQRVLERVVRAGLRVQQFTSLQDDEVLVKIGCTDNRLLDEAEHSKFLLRLNAKAMETIARGEDHRDDVIKDRKTGEIIRTVRRTRMPLSLIDPKGRQFGTMEEEEAGASDRSSKSDVEVNGGHSHSRPRRPSLVEIEADKPARILNAEEIDRVQGKLTRYKPFEYLWAAYDEDDEEYFLAAHYGTQIYQVYSDGSILTGQHRLKLIHMALERSVAPDARTGTHGAGINLEQLRAADIIIAAFPLHLETTLSRGGTTTTYHLARSWSSLFRLPWRQPLNDVRDYFGEQVAMYFAFLGHLSLWLAFPAVLGLVLFIHQMVNVGNAFAEYSHHADNVTVILDPFSLSQVIQDADGKVTANVLTVVPELPYFSLFIALWATTMLQFWKRQENHLAMKWGTINFEKTEVVRVEFKPKYELPSVITGEPTMYYPWRTALFRLLVSAIVVGISITSVTVVFVLLSSISSIVKAVTGLGDDDPVPTWITFGALFVDAVLKIFMSWGYQRLAAKLNNWENHRTDTAFYNSLILKTCLFEACNRYGTLFYLAFVKPRVDLFDIKDYCIPYTSEMLSSFPEGEDPYRSCFGTVGYALLAAFGSALFVDNMSELIWPLMRRWWARRENALDEEECESPQFLPGGIDGGGMELGHVDSRKPSFRADVVSAPALIKSPCEDDFYLSSYDGTMDDFLEIAILFGYATMFASTFPLAPTMAFTNTFIEMRVDSLKLCSFLRRPEIRGAEDIGPWQTVFEIMSSAAVITNAAVILFSTNIYYFEYESTRVWAFLVAIGAVFTLKWILVNAIPNLPASVRIQLRRNEFIIRKLIKREPDDEPEEDEVLNRHIKRGLKEVQTGRVHNADPGIRSLLQRVAAMTNSSSEDIVALFKKLDRDGSGNIDGKEFMQLLRQQNQEISEYDARRIVLALDTDHDGKVDYDEFMYFIAEQEDARNSQGV